MSAGKLSLSSRLPTESSRAYEASGGIRFVCVYKILASVCLRTYIYVSLMSSPAEKKAHKTIIMYMIAAEGGRDWPGTF